MHLTNHLCHAACFIYLQKLLESLLPVYGVRSVGVDVIGQSWYYTRRDKNIWYLGRSKWNKIFFICTNDTAYAQWKRLQLRLSLVHSLLPLCQVASERHLAYAWSGQQA